MTSLLPGLLVAAAASLALNASYVVQHSALVSVPVIRLSRPVASVRALLGQRRWLGGALLGYAGLALNVVALGLAPLALVQTVIAGGLVVVALGAIRLHGVRPRSRDVAAVVLMVAAIAALSSGPAPVSAVPGVPLPALLGFGAAAALVASALAALPGRADGRPLRLALAAGVLYGTTTLAFAVLAAGPGAVPALTALLVAGTTTAAGFFAFQRALQSGPPVPVVTLMTGGTNAVALVGAFLVLGERLGSSPTAVAVHAVGLALVPVAAALAAGGLVARPAVVRGR